MGPAFMASGDGGEVGGGGGGEAARERHQSAGAGPLVDSGWRWR
jgi:hypothetical protein